MYILVDIHMNVLAITIASSAACFPRARGYILPTYPIYVSTSTVDQNEALGNACTNDVWNNISPGIQFLI